MLAVESLSVRFGGLVANDAISLRVEPGELVGLIGPNGAGKTTFVDAVTGFATYSGSVSLHGQRLDGLAPHQRNRRGLARTWQSLELFDELSVLENLLVSTRRLTTRRVLADVVHPARRNDERAERWALRILGLDAFADVEPRVLSLGHAKLLGVARALASNPSIVLLDEPAAGLDTRESAELGRRLREVVAAGVAVLLIDHDMNLVLDICDRIYVLEFGRVIAEGTPTEVRDDDLVIAAYLGSANATPKEAS